MAKLIRKIKKTKALLPETGFLRLKQIIGDKKTGIPPLIPVSAPTWFNGVKSGRFPKPIKFGGRASFWKVEDIKALIKKMSKGEL